MSTNENHGHESALQRRDFLSVAATATVSGSLAAIGLPAALGAEQGGSGHETDASTFRPVVGDRFEIHGATSGRVVAKLLESTGQAFDPNRPANVRRNPFTLMFLAPRGTEFPDQASTLYHPQLGAIDAFVSRVGPLRSDGVTLQVVFG